MLVCLHQSDAGRKKLQVVGCDGQAAPQLGWLHGRGALSLACLLQEHICEGEARPTGQSKAHQLAIVLAQLVDYVIPRICTCRAVTHDVITNSVVKSQGVQLRRTLRG